MGWGNRLFPRLEPLDLAMKLSLPGIIDRALLCVHVVEITFVTDAVPFGEVKPGD